MYNGSPKDAKDRGTPVFCVFELYNGSPKDAKERGTPVFCVFELCKCYFFRVRVRVIVVIWTRVTTRVISQGDRYETGFQGDRYGMKPDFRDIDMA